MSRTGLHRPRCTRALRERPAPDTRLLPTPFPTRRWMVHRLYAASGLYIDALADTTPLTRAYTPRRLNPRRGFP